MKVYFAGVDRPSFLPALWENGARRILINYADYRNTFPAFLGHLQKYNFKVLLDSGAYTFFSRGLEVDREKYAEFLKTYGHHFEGYFNLDVIGDFYATWDNQDYLEGQVLNPIPVYHYGEPPEVLRIMVRRYDYIGIGGMVPINTQKLDSWLEHVFFDRTGKLRYPETKFHGLGLTTYELLKKYPFYSCDSTLWLIARKFKRTLDSRGKQVHKKDVCISETINWHLSAEKQLATREFSSRQRLF